MDSNSHHRPAGLSLTGKPGESRQSIASKSSFTRTLDSLQNFIGLLTTVHFFSVLTTFATYFGVIQSDWHVSPLYFLVGNGSAAQHTRQSHPTSQLCKVRHYVFSPSSWTITCLCCSPLTEHSGNIDKLEKKKKRIPFPWIRLAVLRKLFSVLCQVSQKHNVCACLLPKGSEGWVKH